MSYLAKILFAVTSIAFCVAAGAPAMALMPGPSYSQITVAGSLPIEEVGHRRHYKRHGRRYGRGYRRHHPGIGIYIAPPPVYVAPPVYAAPPVYRSPRYSCDYWASRCAANWSRRSDYLGCMRYEGCY